MAESTYSDNEVIAGLDLGSTKVTVIVAEQTDDGVDIIGIGSVPCSGLKKGVVVNIDATVRAIRAAIEQAETMSGVKIDTVYAGIAGSHVTGLNTEGVAAIANREVTQADVDRVLEQAKAIRITSDRQVLHVLPQQFIVDGHDGIPEPIGMSGVRIEARCHLVTAASHAVENIIKCAERVNLHVAEVVLEPLASAAAVIDSAEREIGVCLVDIGGGTTDIIIYVDGAVVFTSVIPIGGINLTNDIASGLRTPVAEAERLKMKYGCASAAMVDEDETIEVPSVGGRGPRGLSRRVLAEIIEPRVEEIFQAVRHVIHESGYVDMLSSGVVITGGSTLLDGMPEMAEQVLGLPVRRGAPQGVGGLVDVVKSPAYATGVGLVKYGADQLRLGAKPTEEVMEVPVQRSIGGRIGQWFREVF
jgi:cell division protein FtsA